nr:reverse transcriptase domain-containing protein [Tanacetum cinerariifolium]
MVDNRTMEEMLQAPMEGYGDAMVVPDILAENFELKTGLLLLIQENQFHGFKRNNPQDHIRPFNRITSTLKFRDVSNDAIKLMLFPYSLEGAAKIWNMMASYFQKDTASTSGSGSLPSNIVANLTGDLKAITTQSGVSYDGPPIPPHTSSFPKVAEQLPDVTKDTPKLTIPYPSRVNKQKLREKDDNLALKFVEIFRNLHFELSFADALLYMPKSALMFKSLLNNKEKLFDLATTLVNENCSAVILKKLPEKLGDPGKFLIPCDFPELDECLALVDLVVDYVVDPRVSLILERPFLRTKRALIDVYGEELTLRVDDKAITFNVGQTSKYSYNDAELINQIDVACEEYVQEVLGFSNNSKSGNPTPTSDPIIALSSPSLTPFEGGDFNLEEIEACLTSKSIPLGINDTDFDLEGDILLLEELLNKDPSSSPLPLKELNVEEIKAVKSYIDEPSELELTELPSHLEYVFLEGTDKLPVIISKELKDEEKSALLKTDEKDHEEDPAYYSADRGDNDDNESSNDDDDDD